MGRSQMKGEAKMFFTSKVESERSRLRGAPSVTWPRLARVGSNPLLAIFRRAER